MVALKFFAELGSGYEVTESERFEVVSPKAYARKRAKWLHEAAERILREILGALNGIAVDAGEKHVILVLGTNEGYGEYIRACYPEIDNYGVPESGVLVQAPHKPPHLVIPSQDLSVTEGVLAHELTRFCLAHLDLPVWIEEGLSEMIEFQLTGYPPLPIDHDSITELQRFWSQDRIQEFWSGASFYAIDETSSLSRALARMLVQALLLQFPSDRFRKFVLNAKARDSGEQAAIVELGVNLGDLVRGTLQIEGR